MPNPHSKLFKESLQISLHPLRMSAEETSRGFVVSLKELEELNWKGNSALEFAKNHFARAQGIKIEKQKLVISKSAKLSKTIERLDDFVDHVARENLFSSSIWPPLDDSACEGFEESNSEVSKRELDWLYRDGFHAAEKKVFIVDFDRSYGPRMRSLFNKNSSFFDGAAQIASLALGYNDSAKNSMMLKPELFQAHQRVEESEIYGAFCHLLRSQSGLEHVNVVASGAEAVEAALRACQKEHPDRRKVIAFKGSFHGRMLLSLHCTYNPAKREPFEIFKDMVEFHEYPEDKAPHEERSESDEWLRIWSSTDDDAFESRLSAIDHDLDDVLEEEINILRKIRKSLQSEAALAVIAEPILCEGGDRYASARFYRALRVLSRAYDTPLIMDEVQSGFGLGGDFFWHKKFNFERLDGKADFPDCVCVAKKAQAAACISRFEQDLPVEVSLASLYRGYIQGQEVLRSDIALVERRSRRFLRMLEQHLAPGVIKHSRACGLAFAFDVDSPEIVKQLVAERFKAGILFYPAGSHTLRFRMLLDASDRDFAELFTGIRKCFLALEEKGVLPPGKTLEDFFKDGGQAFAKLQKKKGVQDESLFSTIKAPRSLEEAKSLKQSEWNRLFKLLIRHFPQLIYLDSNKRYSLDTLNELSIEELHRNYIESDDICFLDFLWQCARLKSHRITELKTECVRDYGKELEQLQERAYEPARRETLSKLVEYSKDPKSIFIVSQDSEEKIQALCVCAPLKTFSHVGPIDQDPKRHHANFFYGVDLTVAPRAQGQGLGLRLKVEQIIAARNQGAECIRSRNRFPESSSMIQLNQKMGSLIIDELEDAYGPRSSPAKYQSLKIPSSQQRIPVLRKEKGGLLNKGSLANFVSHSYLHNMEALRSVLPKGYQHVYLASGTAEAADKSLKLLKGLRKDASICLSIEGHDFGQSSATARSLGGSGELCFFDWPAIPADASLSEINSFLDFYEEKEILGFFVEVNAATASFKKSPAKLKSLCALFKKRGIPVVFHESRSVMGAWKKDQFFAAAEFKADISFFHAAPHLAVVSCTKEFFNPQPLALISTWDGDEMGLHYLRMKIEEWID